MVVVAGGVVAAAMVARSWRGSGTDGGGRG